MDYNYWPLIIPGTLKKWFYSSNNNSNFNNFAGNAATAQLVPVPDAVQAIQYRESAATHELVFIANAVPALGSATYSVVRSASESLLQRQKSVKKVIPRGEDAVIKQGVSNVYIRELVSVYIRNE